MENLTQKFEQFRSQAQDMDGIISRMSRYLQEGRVPEKDDVASFENKCGDLQELYDGLLQEVTEAGEAQLPENCSVDDIEKAWQASEKFRRQKQLEESRKILERFLQVQAKMEVYQEALLPYQEAAQGLLSTISSENLDEAEEQVSSSDLFLRAIDLQDPDSEEAISLFDEVGTTFSTRVGYGIARGQYYVADHKETDAASEELLKEAEAEPAGEPETVPEVEKVQPEPEKNQEEQVTQAAEEKETVSVSVSTADTKNDAAQQKEGTGEETPEESPAGKAEDEDKESEDVLIKAMREGKISRSSFMKDIFKAPEAAKGLILPMLTHCVLMNLRQMTDYVRTSFPSDPRFEDEDKTLNMIKNGIGYLYFHGFLSEYDDPSECVKIYQAFSLTPNMASAMSSNKKLRRMRIWEIPLGPDPIRAARKEITVREYKELLRQTDHFIEELKSEAASPEPEPEENRQEEMAASPVPETVTAESQPASEDAVPESPKMDVPVNTDEKTEEKNAEQEVEISEESAPVPESRDEEAQPAEDQQKEETTEKEIPISPEALLKSEKTPDDAVFAKLIRKMLDGEYITNYDQASRGSSRIAQPLLLSRAASMYPDYRESKHLYQCLLLSTGVAMEPVSYDWQTMFAEVFPEPQSAEDESMLITACFRAMLSERGFDSAVLNQLRTIFSNYEDIFPSYPMLKDLFNELLQFRAEHRSGFTRADIMAMLNNDDNENEIAKIERQAVNQQGVPMPTISLAAFPKFLNNCFGSQSMIRTCLESIGKGQKDKDVIDFVHEVLVNYCDDENGDLVISEKKIDAEIDKEWQNVSDGPSTFTLAYAARSMTHRYFHSRLEIMKEWYDHVVRQGANIDQLKTARDRIVTRMQRAAESISSSPKGDRYIVEWTLRDLMEHLAGRSPALQTLFSELAITGVISLDDDGYPLLEESMIHIPYFEPWRAVLRHLTSSRRTYEDAVVAINDPHSELFDNLHQLEMIGKFTGKETDNEYVVSREQLDEALNAAKGVEKKFMDNLELSYTYDRITETEKENIGAVVERALKLYEARQNFGIFRQLIQSQESYIDALTKKNETKLLAAIRQRRDSLRHAHDPEKEKVLDRAESLLRKDNNYAVCEEYLNAFDREETSHFDELNSQAEENTFAKFTSESVFRPLFDECKASNGRSMQLFGKRFIENQRQESTRENGRPVLDTLRNWTSRHWDDAQRLVSFWPTRKGTINEDRMKQLMTAFGFPVEKMRKVEGKYDRFEMTIQATSRNNQVFTHPIAGVGTKPNNPIHVVVLYGNNTPQQLLDTLAINMKLTGFTVVLVDFRLEISARRQMAEIFRNSRSGAGQSTYLIIDQVLALFLALHQPTERLSALLRCTLPYTTYQPFIQDSGSVSDEMFIGRRKELSAILDPNGAVLVYGGRQLGKTALLERAAGYYHQPENRRYAVLCSINDKESTEAVAEAITKEMRSAMRMEIPSLTSIEAVCDWISQNMTPAGSSGPKIEGMLLLLDECDDFFEAIQEDKYSELNPLVELRRHTQNRFKFVLTGLHNVCRAKNALRENGVIGQMGTPLCIEPLSPRDAAQLLTRPLTYLGFDFQDNKPMELILTKTNYYPGILQFFGYELVRTVNDNYSSYYSALNGNPPFALRDEQMGSVINSRRLNDSIRDKFKMSLDMDVRYYMLARCIALRSYMYDDDASTDQWIGSTLDDIREVVSLCSIHCLENISYSDCISLMDEMVEMGILSKPQEGLYRLRRRSFVNLIGKNEDEVLEDIAKNNE